MDTSIQNLVATTLAELGMPIPVNYLQTLLMQDGYFVGHKFRYDGGHAVLLADGKMEFYADDGKLLRSIAVEAEKKGAAA